MKDFWLPLITPFRDGELDEASLRRMARHYLAQPVDGLILAATTGEGLTLDDDETARLVEIVAAEVARPHARSISACREAIPARSPRRSRSTAAWPVDGYLIACPYYTRPSQEGLYRHFAALADATGAADPRLQHPVPHRREPRQRDAAAPRGAPEHRRRQGLLRRPEPVVRPVRAKPQGFAVMTGEDALFYSALTQGAEGGILASAHIETARFASVRNIFISGDQQGALRAWRALVDLPRLLFAEPSPAPIKHWLWRTGLIDSPEVRLPMMQVSDALAARIARELRTGALAA